MKLDRKQRFEAMRELDDAVDCLLEAAKNFVAAGCVRDAERASRLALHVLGLKRDNAERPS
jgi:hypothetical protein